MSRIQVGEDETDGDGFHTGPYQFIQYPVKRLGIYGRLHGAVGADAFFQRVPQRPGYQRFDGRHPQIVPVFFQSFPQRQQVPETVGGDQADPGAIALQEGVGRDGGAVDEEAGSGQ